MRRNTPDDEQEVDLNEKTSGWNVGTLYRYKAGGLNAIAGTGWAYYAKCRDQPLGAQDCDIQFVPTDLDKLIRLYDPLLWKPSFHELEKWSSVQ